jgi:hypothetical protein
MSLAKLAFLGSLLVVLSVLAVGCRGNTQPTAPKAIGLKEVHEMYQHYVKRNQKPPHQLSDLAKAENEGIYPVTVASLKRGKIVVVWDIQGNDSGTVMAYEKDAPTQGGSVLMADGTVKQMTAAEFTAAKKS